MKTIADSIQAPSNQSPGIKPRLEAEQAGKWSPTCCYKRC